MIFAALAAHKVSLFYYLVRGITARSSGEATENIDYETAVSDSLTLRYRLESHEKYGKSDGERQPLTHVLLGLCSPTHHVMSFHPRFRRRPAPPRPVRSFALSLSHALDAQVVVVVRLVYPILCTWSSEKTVYDPSKLPQAPCILKATYANMRAETITGSQNALCRT